MSEQHEQGLADAKAALELSTRLPSQAIKLAESSLRASDSQSPEICAYAFTAIGSAYATLGKHVEALRYLHEAIAVAFENRLTYVMARIHHSRGWVSYTLRKPIEAYSDWQAALEFYNQIRHTRGIAWILNHYAESSSSLRLTDRAIRCRVSALELIALENEDESTKAIWVALASNYLDKAWASYWRNELGKVILNAQIATSIILRHGKLDSNLHPNLMEDACRVAGEALLLQSKFEEAYVTLQLAQENALIGGKFLREARIQGAIGCTYAHKGDCEKAIEVIQLAIRNAPATTPKSDISDLYRWLSSAQEASGMFRESIISARKSRDIDAEVVSSIVELISDLHDGAIGIESVLCRQDDVNDRESDWYYNESELRDHIGQIILSQDIDPLTKVRSRSSIASLCGSGYTQAAIFEVANLDAINVEFGRHVGDEVLRTLGPVIAGAAEEFAEVGRSSGSEFLALSNDQGAHEKFEVALWAAKGFPWMAIHTNLVVDIRLRMVKPDNPSLLAA